jgi:hypothetical protein
MTSLINAVGRSLLISSMIPAMVFVTITLLIFTPAMPKSFLGQFGIDDLDVTGIIGLIVVLSFLLGYVLMIMNWGIVRLFEGYYLPFPRRLAIVELWKKRRLNKKVQNSRKAFENHQNESQLHQRSWRQYIEMKQELEDRFPHFQGDLLPLKLGNIYRAFEDYAFNRYGMESVFFWPRLAKVIPEDYASKLVEQNNSIAFLLNASLVSLAIGVEILISMLISLNRIDPWLDIDRTWIQLTVPRVVLTPIDQGIVTVLFCLVIARFFYYGATSTAITHGHYIRTCYDLFRLDLLELLDFMPPTVKGGEEERALWRSVHEFLLIEGEEPGLAAPNIRHNKASTEENPTGNHPAADMTYAWGRIRRRYRLYRARHRLITRIPRPQRRYIVLQED